MTVPTDDLIHKDVEAETKEKTFEKSQARQLTVSEWKVFLSLAYDGHQNKYWIDKKYGWEYPMVHRAMKGLKEIGWVKVFKTLRSEKNVLTNVYGVTEAGLLWLFSRIPRTVDPSLIELSPEDASEINERVRTPITEYSGKDISKLTDLENQDDVHYHLMFHFDTDRIAENNRNLFPLVFGLWDYYKEFGVADGIAFSFPHVAFSALVDYYFGYELIWRFSSIEKTFTYRLYYDLLRAYAENYGDLPSEKGIDDRMVRDAVIIFKPPQLQEIFDQIAEQLKKRLSASLIFLKKVETNVNKNRNT